MNARAKFLWSVRRELWEYRSVFFVPLSVAALGLLGFMINLGGLIERMRGLAALPIAKQVGTVVTPYSLAASVILFSSFLVAVAFCTGALNNERRDRSVLFWKSMPVSDLITVLSKVFIPLAVIPLVAFAIALATQATMLVVSSVALGVAGVAPSTQWEAFPFVQMSIVLLYGIATHLLWYSPIYAWLLLVSGWAKRMPFLWATLPFFAAMFFEKIAFGTFHVGTMLKYRVMGATTEAFAADAMKGPITQLSQMDPARFFATPGLWIGLVFAVVFLAAAIRMRRHREPI